MIAGTWMPRNIGMPKIEKEQAARQRHALDDLDPRRHGPAQAGKSIL